MKGAYFLCLITFFNYFSILKLLVLILYSIYIIKALGINSEIVGIVDPTALFPVRDKILSE